MSQSNSPSSEPTVSVPALISLIHQEFLRSKRYEHSFSLTRLQLPRRAAEPGSMKAEFLLRRKRETDFLCELRPAEFILLSPESENDPGRIWHRFSETWSELHPDTQLLADQRTFPKDGNAEEIYIEWVRYQRDRAEAA